MEYKKNPKLETGRLSNMFFTGGLLVALSLTVFAFEYKTYDEIGVITKPLIITDSGITSTPEIPDFTPPKELPAPLVKEDPIFKPSNVEEPDTARIKDETETNTNPLTSSDTTKRGTAKPFVKPFEKPIVIVPEWGNIDVVQTSAKFLGGDKAYSKFLSDNLKYPNSALRNGIEGTVYVRFILDINGSIMKDCVKVIKSVDPALDAEAIRVVRMSPNWSPALQNERPTKQRLRVPVKFKIQR